MKIDQVLVGQVKAHVATAPERAEPGPQTSKRWGFCPWCGTALKNEEGWLACEKCGTHVNDERVSSERPVITHAHLEALATAIRKAVYPNRVFTHNESFLCARAAFNYLQPWISARAREAQAGEISVIDLDLKLAWGRIQSAMEYYASVGLYTLKSTGITGGVMSKHEVGYLASNCAGDVKTVDKFMRSPTRECGLEEGVQALVQHTSTMHSRKEAINVAKAIAKAWNINLIDDG